jgi:hypothetical protein
MEVTLILHETHVKQMEITLILHEPHVKQMEVTSNRTSLCHDHIYLMLLVFTTPDIYVSFIDKLENQHVAVILLKVSLTIHNPIKSSSRGYSGINQFVYMSVADNYSWNRNIATLVIKCNKK